MGRMTRLATLELGNTNLSGPLPSEFGELMNLVALQLQNSSIGGTVPEEVSMLPNLSLLSMESTHISGVLPDSLCRLPPLPCSELQLQVPELAQHLCGLPQLSFDCSDILTGCGCISTNSTGSGNSTAV